MTDFFAELKRRYIYRIAGAYALVAWVLLQLFNNLTPLLKVPDWTGTMLLVLLIGGFPVALVFAWILDSKAPAIAGGTLLKSATAKLPSAGDEASEHRLHAIPIHLQRAQEAPAREPEAAMPAPADGPSLVVLPFANLSGEPDQDFFADGLTEDIITELSRFRHLFVISRNSAFRYKGTAVDVRQVARELHVQYVVEGSVRKADSRVRVTVQLIDGQADRHIWAERYDRELEDIFALQDEVTMAIVATVSGRVEHAAGERV